MEDPNIICNQGSSGPWLTASFTTLCTSDHARCAHNNAHRPTTQCPHSPFGCVTLEESNIVRIYRHQGQPHRLPTARRCLFSGVNSHAVCSQHRRHRVLACGRGKLHPPIHLECVASQTLTHTVLDSLHDFASGLRQWWPAGWCMAAAQASDSRGHGQ